MSSVPDTSVPTTLPASASRLLAGKVAFVTGGARGIGAAIVKAGPGSLISSGVIKIVAFIFISPLVGMLLGGLMMLGVAWLFRHQTPRKVDTWSKRLQLVSASAYALGHGGNDAQKTIGIIWMLLIATGYASSADTSPPTWTIVSCYAAIGLGTMFGGWRIVRTMGQKITKLKPVGGFCAESGGAFTLFFATFLGVPVSTTHTITGAIVGVGTSPLLDAIYLSAVTFTTVGFCDLAPSGSADRPVAALNRVRRGNGEKARSLSGGRHRSCSGPVPLTERRL